MNIISNAMSKYKTEKTKYMISESANVFGKIKTRF